MLARWMYRMYMLIYKLRLCSYNCSDHWTPLSMRASLLLLLLSRRKKNDEEEEGVQSMLNIPSFFSRESLFFFCCCLKGIFNSFKSFCLHDEELFFLIYTALISDKVIRIIITRFLCSGCFNYDFCMHPTQIVHKLPYSWIKFFSCYLNLFVFLGVKVKWTQLARCFV